MGDMLVNLIFVFFSLIKNEGEIEIYVYPKAISVKMHSKRSDWSGLLGATNHIVPFPGSRSAAKISILFINW